MRLIPQVVLHIVFIGCLLFFVTTANAQNVTVTGRVTDSATSAAIANASVSVKGSNTKGAVTDVNGSFKLTVQNGAVLVISSLNYEPQEVTVGKDLVINVTLASKASVLNDVVVIGYGTRQKKDITGAVASITSKDIEKTTAPTSQLALQGRMSGVYVPSASGNPNDRVSIRVRGVNTFNGPNDPLYVIDGVAVTEGGYGSGEAVLQDLATPNNIWSLIDPSDIESISVLKDASAAAIYGVRASNGVVLITTKRGRGKSKVTIDGYMGIQNITGKKITLLNTQQYAALYQEAYANNPNVSDGTPIPIGDATSPFGPLYDPAGSQYLGNSSTYDWQEQMLNKNAPIRNLNVKISGATEALNYYISTGYYKTEGTLVGSGLNRYSLASNLSSRIGKLIEVGLTSRLVYENRLNENYADLGLAQTSPPWQPIFGNGPAGFAQPFAYMFVPNPAFDPTKVDAGPVYNFADGYPKQLWGGQTNGNVFGTMALNENRFRDIRALGNAYLQVTPVKGLKIKGLLGGDYMIGRNENLNNFKSYVFNETPGNPYATYAGRDSNTVGNISVRNAVNKSITKELTANYTATFFNNHNIDITVGATEQKWFWDVLTGGGALYYLDPNLWNTPEQQVLSQGGLKLLEKRSLLGYIGRIDYKFSDKYYITGTVRRDGSSRFAPGHRWGTFPAVAVAWRITSEKFMEKKPLWLNDVKLRANWGQLGNDQGTRGWAYLSLLNPGITSPDYSVGSGNGNPFGTQVGGAFFPNFANTSLSWETLTTSGAGFDAVLFNNKVNLSVEYYSKINRDIIQNVAPPPSTGIEYTTDINIGSVRNRGVEVQVGYSTKIGAADFNFSGNFTTQSNKVIKLNNGVPVADNIREGYDLGFIYGYKMGGIFQSEAEIDQWLQRNSDAYTSIRPKPGDAYFVDVQGSPDPKTPSAFNATPDGVINSNDRTYLGKTIPGYFYGFNCSGSWKGLDLSAYFYGIGDVQKYNVMRATGETMSTNGANQWATTLNRWTPENPSLTMPRAVYGDPNGNTRTSDRFVENAGFLRLQNIQLGYSLPKPMLRKSGFIEGLRLYVSTVNLLTLTNWSGIDPENDFNPPAKQFLFGLNASF